MILSLKALDLSLVLDADRFSQAGLGARKCLSIKQDMEQDAHLEANKELILEVFFFIQFPVPTQHKPLKHEYY